MSLGITVKVWEVAAIHRAVSAAAATAAVGLPAAETAGRAAEALPGGGVDAGEHDGSGERDDGRVPSARGS